MGNIKHIWYDSSVISNMDLEQKLQSLQIPFVKVSKSNLLIQSDLSSHSLYDQLGSIIEKKSIFIGSFDSSDYWGYLDGDIWTWIKEHK